MVLAELRARAGWRAKVGATSARQKGMLAAAVFATALAVILAVTLSRSDVSPALVSVELPAPGTTATIIVEDGTLLEIPNSPLGRISVLEDALGTPQARSYDGNNWELLKGSSLDCSGDTCIVGLSASQSGVSTRTLLLRNFEPAAPGVDRSNARFLLQASFGPTRETINGLGPGEARFKDWVLVQMALPATLHRAFYRQRVNQPVEGRSTVGRPRGACEVGSRWHRHAFTLADVGKTIVQSRIGAGFNQLQVTGITRHQESDFDLTLVAVFAPFVICTVDPRVGGKVTFGAGCGGSFENPAIAFADPDENRVISAGPLLADLAPAVAGAKVLSAVPAGCALPAGGLVFAEGASGEFYLHSPRLVLQANTLEAPVVGTPVDASCPGTPRTFVSERSCVVSTLGCASARFESTEVSLNEEAMKDVYTEGGKYMYAVRGLPISEVVSPCSRRSRWTLREGGCGGAATSMDGNTRALLEAVLEASFAGLSPNPFVRDVARVANGTCNVVAATRAVLDIAHGGSTYCFRQAHSSELGIYDFSFWAEPNAHPGNREAAVDFRPNPIKNVAESGSAVLDFPVHSLAQWEQGQRELQLVGKLGDTLAFTDLPRGAQSAALAAALGVEEVGQGSVTLAVALSCGSPGEVQNEPALGSRLGMIIANERDPNPVGDRFDEDANTNRLQAVVWTNVALGAADQLRQRVAWVFAQVLVVSATLVVGSEPTEVYVHFYDIFVRHAFGNYRDILKEVSYSPLMARMLSFLRSTSLAYTFQKTGVVEFPDENYAREIMQLFTIGQFRLKSDGTTVLDTTGGREPSYDNDDIMSLARAWTGFEVQDRRSNIEGHNEENNMDPMYIIGGHRDVFPKLGPRGTYIGDGVALCEELPDKAFLRKGAKWRFLGASPNPELQLDNAGTDLGETVMRVELDSASALFKELCNADPDSEDLDNCRFQPDVVLDENLDCLEGAECDVDTVKVVMLPATTRRCPAGTVLSSGTSEQGDQCVDAFTQASSSCPTGCSFLAGESAPFCVSDGTSDSCRVDPAAHTGFYFEYVRPACVHLPFYNGGRRISRANRNHATCADPRSMAASEACCSEGSTSASEQCRWAGGEKMSFFTAQTRCAARSQALCNFRRLTTRCEPVSRQVWSSEACGVKVKVHPDGKVAIVHDVRRGDFSAGAGVDTVALHLQSSTQNWFRAVTTAGRAPAAPAACSGSGCEVLLGADGDHAACLCDTVVGESQVFSERPTLAEAVAQLHIGSPALASFDAGDFALAESGGGVRVWRKRSAAAYTAGTVFEVAASVLGPARLLRNVASTVQVPGIGWSFRNPPTFHNFNVHERRDAEYETDALLDHLVWHPNTGPFIGSALIRHMVTSNPSPRYVKAVATAFREGVYAGIGSGVSGDLAATVAAVLLDAEARSPLLDYDPSFGRTREPLNKVVHFFRAMGLQPQRAIIVLNGLEAATGQEPHDAPNVFSYFQQDYAPGGMKNAGLVAPEAQLMTAPIALRFLNALFSTIKWGLSGCEDGIGMAIGPNTDWRVACAPITGAERRADQSLSRGWLTFKPAAGAGTSNATAEQVVAELDLLLTAGRLDDYARAIIEEEFDAEAASVEGSSTSAFFIAQHLLLSSPQFHSSNQCAAAALPMQNGMAAVEGTVARRATAAAVPLDSEVAAEYKAIVYIKLAGGMDSFNALVPHSRCSGQKDMFAEYTEVRGIVALQKEELLQIDASGSGQVCETFGLHPALTTLQALYQAGDAVILANTGVLVEPVTRDGREQRPSGVFSHNKQQEALDTQFPQGQFSSGVLGRIIDQLNIEGYNASSASISGNTVSLVGDPSVSPRADIISSWGSINILDQYSALSRRTVPAIERLNVPQTSIFGNAWAESLQYSIERSNVIADAVGGVAVTAEFPDTRIGRQLRQVASLIQARAPLQVNRHAFYTELGGFDSHNDADTSMRNRLTEANAALEALVTELKAIGMWDDVTIIFASEFGRTLTTNGRGTDHGWGGNYWMVGGAVRGGRIVGKYPDSLTADGPLNVGRGRLIPTTSWDAVWNGVAQWFGVDEDGIAIVLPNRGNFADLLSQDDLFGGGTVPDEGQNLAGIIGGILVVGVLAVAFVAYMRSTFHNGDASHSNKDVSIEARNPIFDSNWWAPKTPNDYA